MIVNPSRIVSGLSPLTQVTTLVSRPVASMVVTSRPSALRQRPAYYDIHPDGQRFVMVERIETEALPTEIQVVLNWFEELKRLAPTEN